MITLTPKSAKQLRIQGGAPRPRTKIFLISCSFWENLYVGAFPWRVGAASYGKSWIRPWRVNGSEIPLLICFFFLCS